MTFSRWPVRKSVLVNTKTSKAFKGILISKRGPLLTLVDVVMHEAGQNYPVDGSVVIERSNVDFMQVF